MTSVFRLVHLRQLRRQPLRAFLAVLAIAAGVTLTVAVLVARSSLDRSFSAYNQSIGGPATLRVQSRYSHGGIDAHLVPTIEKVDGVQTAVPLVVAVSQVSDRHGHDVLVAVIGADCRAEAIFGAHGCDPAALAGSTDAQPPLIGSALHDAVGPDGVLRTDAGDRSLVSAPVVDDLQQINHGLVAIYPLPVAQTLFGRPDGVDAVYIVPKPGTSTEALRAQLASAVGPQNRVYDANDTGSSVAYVSSALLPFLLLVSLFGLATGGQLVYNTMTLSLEERRRELAIEAAIGGTPRAVFTGVVAEAALLGVGGGLLGIAFGLVAARPFVDNLSTYAEQAAGVHLTVHPTATSTIVGLALGVLASVAAAIVPARRASRLDIAGELVDRSRRADASPRLRGRRALVFAVITVGGIVLAWLGSRDGGLEPWQPPVLLLGAGLAWIFSFRLTATLAPFAVRWFEKVPLLQRGPARVAVSNLMTETRRTSAVLMAVSSAVGMAFALGGIVPGMADGAARVANATAPGRVIVSTLPPNNSAGIDGKLSPDEITKLSQLPGVAAVERSYWAEVILDKVGPVGITATDGPPPHYGVFLGSSPEDAFAAGRVMVGTAMARALDLRPGDSFDIPGRFGPTTLVVGGIWSSPDDLGHSLALPLTQFGQLVGARPPNNVYLRPQPGVTPQQLVATVRNANIADNLKIWDTQQLEAELTKSFRSFLTPFWLLARGLLVVAFIATASTLLLAGVKRRAEHGLLAAVGMPPGDLARMVLVEAGLFGLLGTACGVVGGVFSLEAFTLASSTLTGLYTPFHFAIAPVVLYGALATLMVVAAAALPAWRTSQLDPVVALRYE